MFDGILWFFGKVKGFFPILFAGVFIVIQFLYNLITSGFPYAFQQLALNIFGAERTINTNVHLAIINAPEYNFFSFLEILICCYMIYAVISLLTTLQVKLAGSQSQWGAAMISIIFFIIIETSTIRMVDGQFGFIPIYNGIFFLALNIVPVLSNIFTPSANIIVEKIGQNLTNLSKV